MPRYSTPRSAESRRRTRGKKHSSPSRLRKLVTCLFLPLWLLVVIMVHTTIGENNRNAFFAFVNSGPILQAKDIQKVERTFYVDPDENNEISGQISAIKVDETSAVENELDIALIQNGEEKYETTTVNGEFRFKDVETGIDGMTYTLVAKGSNGFLAYAIHVRPRPDGVGQLAPVSEHYVSVRGSQQDDGTSSVVVPVEANIFRDESASENIGIEASVEPGSDQEISKDFEIEAAAIPPTFTELEKILNNYVSDNAGYQTGGYNGKPKQKELKIAGSFEYAIDEEGNFSGQVVIPSEEDMRPKISDLNVFLLKDDEEFRQDDVEENGEFKLRDVEPGIYGLVAAGDDGFAAVSIRLIEGEKDDKDEEDGNAGNHRFLNHSYVGLQEDEVNETSFTIALITNPGDIRYVRNTVTNLNFQQFAGNNPDVGFPIEQLPIDLGPIQFQGAAFGPPLGPAFGGPFVGAPAPVFGPPAVGGPQLGGFAPVTGGGAPLITSGSRLGRIGLIAGIVALAVDDDDSATVSPNDL